jgi:hypothetical protein
MLAVFLLLSYRLLLERPLGSFKLNTINYAQAVCLAQGCLLLGVYLKTSPFKPVLMERQHLHFLHRTQQKQHRHLSQVVQTQTPGSISGDGSGDSAGPDPGGFDAGTDSPLVCQLEPVA